MKPSLEHFLSVQLADMRLLGMHVVGMVQAERLSEGQQPWAR